MVTPDAYTAFVRDHGAALKRYALALSGSDAAADDLLQASLVKVYLAWDRLADQAAAPAYTRRVIARTHISWWRRASAREHPIDAIPEQRPAGTDPPGDPVGDHDVVWRALATLGPRQRAVVVLRYWEDLTLPQIAHHLGISEGTAKSQLSRALARLRAVLDLPREES